MNALRPSTARAVDAIAAVLAACTLCAVTPGCVFLENNSVWMSEADLEELRGTARTPVEDPRDETAGELAVAYGDGRLGAARLGRVIARILESHESGVPIRSRQLVRGVEIVPVLSWRATTPRAEPSIDASKLAAAVLGESVAPETPLIDWDELAESLQISRRVVGFAIFSSGELTCLELSASRAIHDALARDLLRRRLAEIADDDDARRAPLAGDPVELVNAFCAELERVELVPDGVTFRGPSLRGRMTLTPDGDFLHLAVTRDPLEATEIGNATQRE